MISTKKYLFILLGFLIAIMYLNSASVLAEDRQNRTSDSYYVEEVILMKIRKKFLKRKSVTYSEKQDCLIRRHWQKTGSMLHVTMG